MKKIHMWLMILVAVMFVFFPKHEALDHTYQTSLWTYPPNNQFIDILRRPPQVTFRIGNKTAIGSLMRWHRVRLGIPFKAMTLDIQAQRLIIQARVELIYLVINLFGGLSIGFFGFCLLQNTLVKRRMEASMSSSSDHRLGEQVEHASVSTPQDPRN